MSTRVSRAAFPLIYDCVADLIYDITHLQSMVSVYSEQALAGEQANQSSLTESLYSRQL
jgi:hypothetical protein